MSFTDEDLGRLKADLMDWMSPEIPLKRGELKDLLARLEAAERFCYSYFRPHDETCGLFDRGTDCTCSISKLAEAWRKSAGYSGEIK